MKTAQLRLAILVLLYLSDHSIAKILRNNALMDRMVSHFQKDRRFTVSPETEAPRTRQPARIMSLMENLLCRNFPSIPCNLIMQDETLRDLLERSVKQIRYKSRNIEKTTTQSLAKFPVVNSEELSNFLQVSNTGYFAKKANQNQKSSARTTNGSKRLKSFWSHERQPKKKLKLKKSKRSELYSSRKQMRKFYPHKIKYKDKNNKRDLRDYSKEEMSMSVEVPDLGRKNGGFKAEVSDTPVWRIDYMKHGEPSLNMFAYEDDRLKGKIMQAGPNVIVDENVLEHAARKDVLHPDLYIRKRNFVRKSPVNSEGLE